MEVDNPGLSGALETDENKESKMTSELLIFLFSEMSKWSIYSHAEEYTGAGCTAWGDNC